MSAPACRKCGLPQRTCDRIRLAQAVIFGAAAGVMAGCFIAINLRGGSW